MRFLPKGSQAAFKLWTLGFLFFLIGFRLFDVYYYPQTPILSDRIILSIMIVSIGYLWIQEIRDRYRLQRINEQLIITQKKLKETHLSTITTLVLSLEAKDPYARGHSERVTKYSVAIAKELGLSQEEIAEIERAGKLHDIGKLGIDDAILSKPGLLTDKEYAIVKTHPQRGTVILEPLDFLSKERTIMRHHHERFDGGGYPDRLKGEEIPLGARIMALADAFDAMKSERPYRQPLPEEEILSEIKKNAGSQFDPKVVEAFLSLVNKEPQIFNLSCRIGKYKSPDGKDPSVDV
jgi:HD-GYP domain-containing protein (c-di-GMP phosphodiesterase class II)